MKSGEGGGESPGVLGNHEDNVRIELCTGIPTIVIILSTHLVKCSWEKICSFNGIIIKLDIEASFYFTSTYFENSSNV